MLLAAIFLYFGWSLPQAAVAQDQPRGKAFQIELTMNQLLGEPEAARYQEIIPADKKITWEVYFPNNDSDGVPGSKLLIAPAMGHELPDAKALAEALEFLNDTGQPLVSPAG